MIYVIVLLGFLLHSISAEKSPQGSCRASCLKGGLINTRIAPALFLTVFIGMRFEVGADWAAYQSNFHKYAEMPFLAGLGELREFGWAFLMRLFSTLGSGFTLPQLFCAAVLVFGIFSFSKIYGCFSTNIVALFPTGIVMLGMGFTKQSLSVGLMFLSLSWMNTAKNRVIPTLIVATLIHRAALLPLIQVFFSKPISSYGWQWIRGGKEYQMRYAAIAGIGAMLLIMAYQIVQVSPEDIRNYLVSDYTSRGLWPRHSSLLLAAVYIVRCRLTSKDCIPTIYLVMALSSIGLFGISIIVGPLAMIDRLLYFQLPMLVFGVNVFMTRSENAAQRVRRTLFVGLLSLCILSGWLFFGSYAYYWVPYRNLIGTLI